MQYTGLNYKKYIKIVDMIENLVVKEVALTCCDRTNEAF